MANSSFIEITALTKLYKSGHEDVKALDGINPSIEKGELLAISGPSGS